MGATYWDHLATCETAEEALLRIQIRFFRDRGYDLPRLLARRIKDMTEAVHSCEKDDPYNLLDFYRDALDRYRRMEADGGPEDPVAQIDMLRRIEAISGDRVGNILDMTGISQGSAEGRVEPLAPERIEEIFGTTSPSLAEARKGTSRIAASIPRGTAICFQVYEDGRPVAWLFAGYSAD